MESSIFNLQTTIVLPEVLSRIALLFGAGANLDEYYEGLAASKKIIGNYSEGSFLLSGHMVKG
jgi:hypothetical protein